MATDYAKKTVADLTEILKSRGLSHTGKKAELIARLSEDDTNKATSQPAPEPTPQEESVEPAAIETTEASIQPEAETTQQPEEDSTNVGAMSTDIAEPAPSSFAMGLGNSDVNSELARRKARAERFGTGRATADGEGNDATPTVDSEASRALERAKRFGTGQTALGKLDEALSSERERGSKRKHISEEEKSALLSDPGLKRSFVNRGRGGRQGGHIRSRPGGRNKGPGPAGVSKNSPAFVSDKDRLAAEARKKKFATA